MNVFFKYVLIIITQLFIIECLVAQTTSNKIKADSILINWTSQKSIIGEDFSFIQPQCDECYFDEIIPNLPKIDILLPLENFSYTLDSIFSKSHLVYDSIYSRQIKKINFSDNEWFPQVPVKLGQRVFIKKKEYQSITIFPIQIHRNSENYRKYTKIKYHLRETKNEDLIDEKPKNKVSKNSELGKG